MKLVRIEIAIMYFVMSDVTGAMAALSSERAKVARFHNLHHEGCKKSPLINSLSGELDILTSSFSVIFASFYYPFKIGLRDYSLVIRSLAKK